jgi:DnaJ-class molecular chaperone
MAQEVDELPAKTYVCPCCEGQGVVHADSPTEAEPSECAECDASGKVSRQQREELLTWRQRCRSKAVTRPGRSISPAARERQ